MFHQVGVDRSELPMTKLLGDLKGHRAIIVKGFLFLLLGILAAGWYSPARAQIGA
jgi:hypothetical protein